MKKFIHTNKMFSINTFIIAFISLFYLNSTSIDNAFWGFDTKTITTEDGCYTTETTYKTYYRLWMPTKNSTITDIKMDDDKCY